MCLQQRPYPCAGLNPVANLRRRLRAGCARAALLAVPAALSLGVLLPQPAAAGNITLSSLDTSIGPGVFINATSTAPAIFGASGTPWTIANAGTITGDNFGITPPSAGDDWAIDLQASGVYLRNESDGLIEGYVGAYLGGGTVTNAGTILGGSGNNAFGVEIANGGSIMNSGMIEAGGGDAAIYLPGGGIVTNSAGAVIDGGQSGILVTNAPGQVINAGMITGTQVGIGLIAGGTVSNLGTASLITGSGAGVVFGAASGSGFVYNQGTITSTDRYGVYLGAGGGTVTNSGMASKISSDYGVLAIGSVTLTNQGTIIGSVHDGVEFIAGGTVTNSGAASYISGARNGVYVRGALGSVTNAGTIIGNSGAGVDLDDGGTVTNAATGTISGVTGIVFGGSSASTLINAGTIEGATAAVQFGAGNDLLVIDRGAAFFGIVDGGGGTNTLELAAGTLGNAGTIVGIGSGFTNFQNVVIDPDASWQLGQTNTIATLTNAGTLTNTGTLTTTGVFTDSGLLINSGGITGTGVNLTAGASVSNTGAESYISGATNGVKAGGAAGTVTNAGSIIGNGGVGVYLTDGGAVTNDAGGLIHGTSYGVQDTGGTATISNGGTIIGDGSGIALSQSGTVNNNAGGSISGYDFGIAGSGQVANSGTITATGATGSAIELSAESTVANLGTAAQITGAYGIRAAAGGTLTNQGTITGSAHDGVEFSAGGTVTNSGTASLISGGNGAHGYGVNIQGAAGMVTNAGTIIGHGGAGILLGDGGTITNTGLIQGTAYGVQVTGGTATITNNGTITATGNTGIGVAFTGSAQGTVDNFGMISGAGGTAVQFAGGTNELIIENGGVLQGQANGSNGDNTLVLIGSGRLSEAQAEGFQSVLFENDSSTIDSGSTVENGEIGSGSSVTNQGMLNGGLAIQSGGALDNAGNINSLGSFSNAGMLNNSGTITEATTGLTNAGILNNSGTILNGTATGVYVDGGTLTNSGTIVGLTTGAYGDGGTLTNMAGGYIRGDTDGVKNISGPNAFVLTNSGTIFGFTAGVDLGSGTLNNMAGGYINGADYGVKAGPGGVVTNAGTILDNGIAAVALASNATLTNMAGATVSGARGVLFTGSGASVTNAGTIAGTTGVAVQFDAAGANSLTLESGSVLNGSIDGGGGANAVVLDGTGSMANTVTDFGAGSRMTVAGDWTLSGDIAIPTVEIAAGGTLAGTASITGALDNDGTLAPGMGGAIGTLHVNGAFTQSPGGTLEVSLTPGGASELQIAGTAVLAGNLVLAPSGGNFASGTTLTFLTASGGITGNFADVTSTSPLLIPALSFDATDGFVSFSQRSVVSGIALVGGTANEAATAGGFDAANIANPAVLAPVLDHLDTLTAAGLKGALGQMSGEAYADTATMALGAGALFTDQIQREGALLAGGDLAGSEEALDGGNRVQLASLGTDPIPNADRPWGVWMSGYGQSLNMNGNGNANALDGTYGGGLAGLDYAVRPGLRVGMALGAATTNFSLDALGDQSTVQQTQFAVYADDDQGPAYLDGLAGAAYGDGNVTRKLGLAGGDQASGHITDTQWFASAQAGYGFDLSPRSRITPFAELSFDQVNENGTNESNAGALDLIVAGHTTNSFQSRAGARFTANVPVNATKAVTTELSVAWAHEYLPTTRVASLAFGADPQAGFQVAGVQPSRDAAEIGAGIALALSQRASLDLHYQGSFSGVATGHAASATFTVGW